jgi:hypothetical protein
MSDETARQIEYLIEATQQDIQIKASLLADVVEGEVLVSEMLQDIKLDVADIKEGLFQFFNDEQARFKIQQDQYDEVYFRTLEALRERSGTPTQGQGGVGGAGGDAGDGGAGGAGAGAVAGAIAGGAAAGFAGRTANLLLRRIPQLAIVAGAIAAGVDYFAEFEEQLASLKAEGIDPETAMTEAATQAAGKLTADITDLFIEQIGNLGLDLLADELGMTPAQVAEFRESIGELDGYLSTAMIGLVDRMVSFFGDETSIAQERQTADEIADIKEQTADDLSDVEENLAEAKKREARLAEIEEELDTASGMERLGLVAEKAKLQLYNKTFGTSEELEQQAQEIATTGEEQVQDVARSGQLSQAGFAAEQDLGQLDTAQQQQFRTEVPSSEKEEWLKENTDPLLLSASESGAIKVQLLELQTGQGQLARAGAIAITGHPVEIEDLKALENLSADQLEAILINDDILLRSRLKGGALDNGTRKIVEYLYRVNSGQIVAESSTPNLTSAQTDEVQQLDLGGTIEPGQAAIVGEKGPELVLGPAEVVGREDTGALLSGSSPMLAGALAAQVNQTTVQQPIPVIVTNVETAALSITPSPTISAAVPVSEMSSNMLAMSSAPVIISSTQGGSTVTNMVNNSSTNVIGGGAPARSSDVGHRRLQDRMQGVV